MVSWGLLVGLMFLPVVLSICGPVSVASTAAMSTEASAHTQLAMRSTEAIEEPTQAFTDDSRDSFEAQNVLSDDPVDESFIRRLGERKSSLRSFRSVASSLSRNEASVPSDDDDSFVSCIPAPSP